jgi:type IV secretion system protein VirB9
VVAPAVARTQTRDVAYDSHAVIHVTARLRMTTLVILPENEEILDFVCGDKDFWIISGAQNLAYLKPAKAGATTNLNLVTAAGHVYSFLLTEGGPNPDLKLFVVPDPQHPLPSSKRPDPSDTLERANRQLAAAREEAGQARRDADRVKADGPLQLRFPYVFKVRTRPFQVTAIYHDDRFTYIRMEGRELPAVYEVVDNVPNLVAYHVDQGVYVVSKVIDHGYLAIGSRRLSFDTTEK